MDEQKTTDVLNRLLEISLDGEQGFAEAKREVSDDDLAGAFGEAEASCRKAAAQLREKIASLGGEPATSGHATAVAHRAWMDVKQALAANDRKAVLTEVVRGERYAARAYEEALQEPLDGEVRDLVAAQSAGARENLQRFERRLAAL